MIARFADGNLAFQPTQTMKSFAIQVLRKEARNRRKLLRYHKAVMSGLSDQEQKKSALFSIDSTQALVDDLDRAIKILKRRQLK